MTSTSSSPPAPTHRLASIALWTLAGAAVLGFAYPFFAPASSAIAAPPASATAAPFSLTGEVDQSRLTAGAPFDHSVVNQHSTAHESDAPGASIAAYGP